MKFKLHWGKAKVKMRFRSPLEETDYEGNDLWTRAFPKPRPLTQNEKMYYAYLQGAQKAAAQQQAAFSAASGILSAASGRFWMR